MTRFYDFELNFFIFMSFLGAFVLPYILILFLVGKPAYFLEMIMGQFSSRGTVKVFDCVPAMRGINFNEYPIKQLTDFLQF